MAPICEKWKILPIPSPAKENPKRTMWKERGAGSGRVGANPQNSANTSVQHIIRWHDKRKTEVDIELVTLLVCVSHSRGHAILSIAPADSLHKQETTSLKTTLFFVSQVFQKLPVTLKLPLHNVHARIRNAQNTTHTQTPKVFENFQLLWNFQCTKRNVRHATQDKRLTKTMIPKGVSTSA